MRKIIGLGCVLALSIACGGAAGGTGSTSPTGAEASTSVAYKGDECHAYWQHPKDADGKELPWTSAKGVNGVQWAKGAALVDGSNEKLVAQLVCFDAIASDETIKRHTRFDDRRFDVVSAAILVDECVESGKCTSDELVGGLAAWYAHELDQAKLSAASKKLEASQELKDAFVDRTVANIAKLDAYTASLTPAQRAYDVDLPNTVHEMRAVYYKVHDDAYGKLERLLDKLDHTTGKAVEPSIFTSIATLRTDAVAQCKDASQCLLDPMFADTSRALIRAYLMADMAFEAKAQLQVMGTSHYNRSTVASQIWISQSAYRKLHADAKPPIEITEEGADPTASASAPQIQTVRGEIASITADKGAMSKVVLKDAVPAKVCSDTAEVDKFDGTSMESMRIIYKQSCVDAPAAKNAPFMTPTVEVAKVKPGAMVVATTTGTKGVIARVVVGDKVVQLGADRLANTSGDPLTK